MRGLTVLTLCMALGACGLALPLESATADRVDETEIAASGPTLSGAEIQQRIHRLANDYRVSAGVRALAFDDTLASIARRHSRDMAHRNYFSHEDPVYGSPTDRAKASGYTCVKQDGAMRFTGIAENIAMQYTYSRYFDRVVDGNRTRTYDWSSAAEIAAAVVDGWMQSSGHRANLLDNRADKHGIGVYILDDRVFVTQNIC